MAKKGGRGKQTGAAGLYPARRYGRWRRGAPSAARATSRSRAARSGRHTRRARAECAKGARRRGSESRREAHRREQRPEAKGAREVGEDLGEAARGARVVHVVEEVGVRIPEARGRLREPGPDRLGVEPVKEPAVGLRKELEELL
eukprot:2325667-Prymnesium_polylepis.1